MIPIEKTFSEILGDISSTGYSLYVHDKEIPIFYDKSISIEYPEIRIQDIDEKDIYFDRFANSDSSKSLCYTSRTFQVDLYSQDKIELKYMRKAIFDRIRDFFILEYMPFTYTSDFNYDNVNGYYFNPIFSNSDDNEYRYINKIEFKNNLIPKVDSLDDLVENSWYYDENGLYVKSSEYDIKDIIIVIALQGKLFSNGDLLKDRNIISYKITRKQIMSDLENNEVERFSFDIDILFNEEYDNGILPDLQGTKIIRYD